jgi:16S rRNA (cytosine967-C5)-methyltransferase
MLPKDAAIRESVPPFFEASLKAALGKNFQQEMVLMNTPAPFDLRVNISRISRQRVLDIFEKDGLYGTPTPYSPWGIRFKERVPLNAHPLYEQGLIDIQDEGAQSLVYDCPSPEADSPLLLDYCAGAGGKTLAFAEKWLRHGTFVMTDYEPHRLEKARERLKRQGIKAKLIPFDQAKLAPYQEKADMVFVDAPCTGTGTWRRNPELKWAFDQQKFHTLLETQGQILEKASSYVKQGGLLAYATCSLLPEENDHQIKRFSRKTRQSLYPCTGYTFWKKLYSLYHRNRWVLPCRAEKTRLIFSFSF